MLALIMDKQKLQLMFRYAGYICLIIVVIGQFFKEQTQILQKSLPFFVLASLIFLLTSIYLKAKSGEFNHHNLKIKFMLFFVFVLVSLLILIYQLTKI